MQSFDKNIYTWFESTTPYLIAWIGLFFLWTVVKILITIVSQKKFQHSGIKSELPGIPLTLCHTVVWYKSILSMDPTTFILFAWWGPGFLISAYIVLFKKNFDWPKYGKITAYMCKITYVVYIGLFFYLELFGLIFVFSVWIIQDQICLIWFEKNADRSRRLIEDKWLPRIGYPLFLLTPFFTEMKHSMFYQLLGTALLIVWGVSIIKILRDGNFFLRPNSYKDFLRNIVYENR